MRVRRQIFSSLFACFLLCSVVLWLSSSAPVMAQSTSTGTVVGNITDPSGAVVSGATVTLTDTSTKATRSATSNDAGRYVFVDVTPAVYDLTVSKQGFSTSKTQTEVKIGIAVTANMALQVGGANVVVEVTAVGNEMQTMNSTVGNTLTSETLDNLPSIGRDVNTFIEL
ncbi:MAG TPA: carboxypeptidase-like regulatory domain-containing protein, partial [Candidatus Sulfotelmatobacter sp.]|nr:carboxypeptidase-like regulatory domain-containing protein [Candidatus Sulfotelmatobacter sp.]